ncbi:hypothetical protein PC118_g25559 [Phytophthora cactorum]|uniref:Dynein heavy chain tail domain-containing protein n=1 Tax=Phytophthora cactorum TaxID=29920 RepID=A0A8T1E2S0_9STRA|nr:hypothetical protein PC118_g25559 [Phytophthora cactorum]
MEKLKQISPRIVLEPEDSKEAMKLYTNVMAMLQEHEVQNVKQWGISIETSSKAKLKLPLIRRDPVPGSTNIDTSTSSGAKGQQQQTCMEVQLEHRAATSSSVLCAGLKQRGPTLVFMSPLRSKVPPAKWVLAGVAMLMEVV